MHAYKPGGAGWIQGCWLPPAPSKSAPRGLCGVCDEASTGVVDRIDTRTGRLVQFHVCGKHTPGRDAADALVNARQFEAAWVCKPGFRPRR